VWWCDLQAIAVQDRVLIERRRIDPHYHGWCAGAFVLVLNCGGERVSMVPVRAPRAASMSR
jgi:hypothetical protein